MSRVSPLIYATVRDAAGNAQRITEQSHRIKTLQYTDSEKKADKCVLTVDNFDLSNFDDQVWAHGNFLEVSWGYAGNMSLARDLVITKVVGFTELKIEARARSVLMDTVRKSKTFENMTRGEVAKAIAEANGYTASNYLVSETEQRFAFITQPKISDAQMLRKLAHQQGFEFYVDHSGLHWHERKLIQRAARTFIWYTDQGRGDVLNIAVESDVTKVPRAVKKVAHDPATGVTTTAEASDSTDKEREGTATVTLTKSDDLLHGSTEYAVSAGMSVGESVWESAASKPEAAAAEAKAAFRRAQRGAVKMKLEAVGDPSMLAKTICNVSGVGQRLTGNYYVKEVVHNVAAGNYKMQCNLISDGTGPTSKTKRLVNEEGLPEVSRQATKAKLGPGAGEQAGKPPANDSNNPGELEVTLIRDKAGGVAGYGPVPR